MSAGKWLKIGITLFTFLFFFIWVMEMDVFARVGGSRSSGSRGSRSYSSPSQTPSSPSPTRQPTSPAQPMGPQMPQQPSMWRSLAMGVAGGFLGSMLFSGISHGMGMGGFGGSGFGLIEIILIGGILYFLYAYFKRKRQAESTAYYQTGTSPSMERQTSYAPSPQQQGPAITDVETGLRHIRQLDPSFDENRFSDLCMDNFFKIQGAWTNRDMTSVKNILTEEMFGILQGDADTLKVEKKINKLDNIAVRSVEMSEAWQEGGQDFITVRFMANLLDYTESESGQLLSGSKTEPVKFVEYWTFTRPAGSNKWQLSAINQDG
ncbi:MAG: Tim44 domain-containing protein [Syntrophaceae bacterium]|nr:Tim44 domain-containing protein [Syntrophaceae bacterium]